VAGGSSGKSGRKGSDGGSSAGDPSGWLARAAAQAARNVANREAGDLARDAIAARYPGSETEVSINIAQGLRRVDVLTPDGTAIESKLGYKTLRDTGIKSQIAKDQLIMQSPRVNRLEWVFTPNQWGAVGPSAPLAQALGDAGISWDIAP
jgi:hypothetical protein